MPERRHTLAPGIRETRSRGPAPSATPQTASRSAWGRGRAAGNVGGRDVEAVRESWLVEDRWWSDRPLRRRYWEIVTDDGRNLVVFRELAGGALVRAALTELATMPAMPYLAASDRYDAMTYRRCGRSGLQLPAISLGLWNNFGDNAPARDPARDHPPRVRPRRHPHRPRQQLRPAARRRRAQLRPHPQEDLAPYRDELIISTKAGYDMWPGPYGEWGSRKYLLASLDQSLQRMGLDYVDIFYSHRLDPDTPLEETLGAVDTAVKQGKALYAGISSYSGPRTTEAVRIFRDLGTPLLIHQPSYSLLNRWIEEDLLDVLGEEGVGSIVFSPLGAGHADREVPRRRPRAVARRRGHVPATDFLSEENLARVRALNEIAQRRGQTLAQMAIAWVLRDARVTSALIGARTVAQLEDSLGALDNLDFSGDELAEIDQHAVDGRDQPVGGLQRDKRSISMPCCSARP